MDNVREDKDRHASFSKKGPNLSLEKGEANVGSLAEGATKRDVEVSTENDHKSFESEAKRKLASTRVTLRPEHVELTCIASVLELSLRLRNSLSRLDVLICNAGTGGVTGIDWLKAARRVPLNFVKELTCPTFKIAAVGWLAEAQRRLKGGRKGNEKKEREKKDMEDDEKVTGASDGGGRREEKDPPLGMVFASNVLGHYVLGHEIAPLMRRKKWMMMTEIKGRENDHKRTVLHHGSSSDGDYIDADTIHSEHESQLPGRNYERSHVSHSQDSSGSGSSGDFNTLQTTGDRSHSPINNVRRNHLRNSNSSRIVWISSLEAYDHSLHFECSKDNNLIQSNANNTTTGRKLNDIQGLTHPLAYESSKRLTDILILTSELDSVRRSWVRKYLSFDDKNDNQIVGKSDTIYKKKAINNHSDTSNAEMSSVTSPSTDFLPPRLYLAHPGICATSIVTLPFYLLELLMTLSLYVARWIGSPWHTADAYTGAGAPVRVALAGWDDSGERLENTIKWGSGTDRWGNLVIRETRVQGWDGSVGDYGNDTNDENLGSTIKTNATSINDNSLPSSLSTQSSHFEDLGWQCWREMEQLRVMWMERIDELADRKR